MNRTTSRLSWGALVFTACSSQSPEAGELGGAGGAMSDSGSGAALAAPGAGSGAGGSAAGFAGVAGGASVAGSSGAGSSGAGSSGAAPPPAPSGGAGGSAGTGAPGTTGGSGGSGATSSTGDGGTSDDPSPPVVVEECTGPTPTLAVELLDTTRIADMGAPFDPNRHDEIGPADWNTNYGKSPELVAVASGDGFDVLWRDAQAQAATGYVVRIEPAADGYAITRAYRVELLGTLMGFTRDSEGNYYYATGVDEAEEIDEQNPPPGQHRADIVRVVRFSPGGCVTMESDVGLARAEADGDSEPIVNPMVAGSSRLAYGDGQLALVHSINTAPDDNGVRHQKALTTHLDATTGAATRTSTMWVSHSFDQRLFWDGQGFVELHLGDAFPREIALGRFTAQESTDSYGIYAPKGAEGDNATYTRLGAITPVASGEYGYFVVFATDRSPQLATAQWQALVGTRDVALVRVRRDFAQLRPRDREHVDTGAAVHTVESSGQMVDNYVHWVTDYGESGSEVHAGRPRIAALGDDRFVVLWERWEPGQRREQFVGTFGLEIDSALEQLTPATRVSDSHIPRGDDLLSLGDRAVWVYGDEEKGTLELEVVRPGLEVQVSSLP